MLQANVVQKIGRGHDVMGSHIKTLVPIRVQSFLDNAGSMCLLSIDGDYREWVRETENVSFRKTIGRNDCIRNRFIKYLIKIFSGVK